MYSMQTGVAFRYKIVESVLSLRTLVTSSILRWTLLLLVFSSHLSLSPRISSVELFEWMMFEWMSLKYVSYLEWNYHISQILNIPSDILEMELSSTWVYKTASFDQFSGFLWEMRRINEIWTLSSQQELEPLHKVSSGDNVRLKPNGLF